MTKKAKHRTIYMYCDGASRGNPGPASIGVVALEAHEEEPLFEISEAIGKATNNIAEYTALVRGLETAQTFFSKTAKDEIALHVRMDSQLVVEQMKGNYKVKNAGLIPLYKKAATLYASFAPRHIEHVPREQNKKADALANLALDGGVPPG
ncbi:MAG: ribonuclease HI family protein [Spirochaetia bacterium]|nr:ribonuclease HI family protein [Spirochaetia bacterium]